MKLSEIIKNFPELEILGKDVEVKNLCIKAQDVKEGDLFIALPGEKSHGLEWEKIAVKNGAKAILSDRKGNEKVTYIVGKNLREILPSFCFSFYGNPQKGIKIIGITGTTGKTTTSQLIYNILSNYKKTALIGTIEYKIGKKNFNSHYTTPESPILSKLFFEMNEENVEYLVMEVSSHSLKQKRVESLSFHRAIFTNIGRDHLDFHKTFEDYINSKFHLIDLMEKDGLLIYNLDEENFSKLRKVNLNKISYSLKNAFADFHLKKYQISTKGTEGLLEIKGENYPFKIPLIGIHNLYNFLAALSCLYSIGLPLKEILESFEKVPQVKGRMEKVDCGQNFPVIIDYAHTPEGFEYVLKTLKELYGLKIITVFGAGGDRDKGKRKILGEVASKYSEIIILTEDNPRSEDPAKICENIKEGIISSKHENFLVILNRQEAIRKAIALANQNFLVAILGKGHENYQIYKDKTVPFSDYKTVVKALKEIKN